MSGAAKKEAQKKDLSYHYWHGRGGGDAPLATPQKLTPDELAALSLQPKPAGVAASAWNAAGTWEERNWTSWAQTRLTELVTGLRTPLGAIGGELTTTGVSSCTGDATVLTVRGKLRHGFELDVTIAWVAVLPAKAACDEPREVKGTVQVADASRDAVQDGDLELVVKVDKATTKKATDAEASAVTAAAKALRKPLLEALKVLDAEMLARVTQAEAAPAAAA